MSHRFSASTRVHGALTAVIAVALLIPANVAAQTKQSATKAPAQAWTKKTPDGQPDLQGIWSTSTNVPLERNVNCGAKEFYTDAELALPAAQRCPPAGAATAAAAPAGQRGGGAAAAGAGQRGAPAAGRGGAGRGAAAGGQATAADVHYDLAQFALRGGPAAENNRTSLIIGPDGRIPPLSAIGQKRQADLAAANRTNFDAAPNRPLAERCLVWGAQGPPIMSVGYNNSVKILQGQGYVMIMPEMMQDARVIPLDASRASLSENVRTWQGDSRGHWEGDTLVIETKNFNGRNPFQRVGSENMRLTERIKRVNENTLLYEYTIDDPVWTKPWTVQVPWAQAEGPLFEYACHEGNYGMANILSGARATEKAAAEAAKK